MLLCSILGAMILGRAIWDYSGCLGCGHTSHIALFEWAETCGTSKPLDVAQAAAVVTLSACVDIGGGAFSVV